MRVLYILHTPHFHGATISFLTLLRGVISRGITPYVIIPRDEGNLKNELLEIGAKVYIQPVCYKTWPKINTFRRFIFYPYVLFRQYLIRKKLERCIIDVVRQERIDVVHTNVGPICAGHYAAEKCGIPHVWHIREYGDLDFGHKMMPTKQSFRRLLKKDWVITITKDLLRYNQLCGYEKAFAIYNGVRDADDIFMERDRERYFVCASRVVPTKGHDMVVSAFSKFYVTNKDYRLVILGDGNGEFIKKLKEMSVQRGCAKAVVFVGHTSDVTSYMKKAKALIVASLAEGFGRMTAEACFAGCPVIGRNLGGTKEILEETGGILFNTEQELVNAMSEIANMDEVSYFKLSGRAQEKARSLYSQQAYISKVLDIYTQAING